MNMYDWVTLLYSRNYHNLVNYISIKKKKAAVNIQKNEARIYNGKKMVPSASSAGEVGQLHINQ